MFPIGSSSTASSSVMTQPYTRQPVRRQISPQPHVALLLAWLGTVGRGPQPGQQAHRNKTGIGKA